MFKKLIKKLFGSVEAEKLEEDRVIPKKGKDLIKQIHHLLKEEMYQLSINVVSASVIRLEDQGTLSIELGCYEGIDVSDTPHSSYYLSIDDIKFFINLYSTDNKNKLYFKLIKDLFDMALEEKELRFNQYLDGMYPSKKEDNQ